MCATMQLATLVIAGALWGLAGCGDSDDGQGSKDVRGGADGSEVSDSATTTPLVLALGEEFKDLPIKQGEQTFTVTMDVSTLESTSR